MFIPTYCVYSFINSFLKLKISHGTKLWFTITFIGKANIKIHFDTVVVDGWTSEIVPDENSNESPKIFLLLLLLSGSVASILYSKI